VVNMYSIDQGGQPMKATSASFANGELKYAIMFLDGDFDGKLSSDHNSIDGMWHQGQNSLPLLLVRATPATEWTIPAPPPQVPAMAANADPSFDVATSSQRSEPAGQALHPPRRSRDHHQHDAGRPDQVCLWSTGKADRRSSGLDALGQVRY